MPNIIDSEKRLFHIKLYLWTLAVLWIVILSASAIWNFMMLNQTTIEAARIQARTILAKDIIYRRWNAQQDGVYGVVNEKTPPNPYLSDQPERDIQTPSGKQLTMINPAYMTRQVHELQAEESGVLGHITSLNPIRPENAADGWETEALREFENGKKEVSSIEMMNKVEYLRLMGPLVTEESCLKCHAKQGYKMGDIRGGISVSVPMKPLWQLAVQHKIRIILVRSILLILGLIGIFVAGWKFLKEEKVRTGIELEREALIASLQEAAHHIKTLKGLIPICSSCKKIRDDKGFWNNVDSYIQSRTEAEFSHGICPDCMKKLYPDFMDKEDEDI